ncbi:ADAMTS-like protein 1 isoform X1 [Nerophis lumbriciformis]|uniref:ADAMTS-like protein 1 isoform X1 n=1 Tax=Nerophis lumbriciformis TaxID=546530 RepID=UPI002AE04342|nr:ADAMTS-like protein 1 isoform X1 [Nerophis lumbriciformis]
MKGGSWEATGLVLLAVWAQVVVWANHGDAVFIREFTLIRRDNLSEAPLHDASQKPEDSSSRTARSEEDRDTLWDAWGSWSECSRTCGGGASYSLRRCLNSKTCEGQNIKYRTCSNVECPADMGDFRAQQCSAHADVRYQGRYHDWLPLYNDPDNPCTLKCKAEGSSGVVVELAPKVLDGTRCYTESLDMCISGACQIVGCDHELGSAAKEDNCGVCSGDGSSCRLVRGHYKYQHASGKTEDTVVVIPYQSRHVRLVLKGPDHLYVGSKTLQGVKGQLVLNKSGQYHLENTTLDYQKLADKEVLRIPGPLWADFTIQVQFGSGADSVIQYIFYQPIIHRWRETDFFPCSVTCGGGYQLTSAECFDIRSGRVVVDQYCHYYPENIKPKPKLEECNMEPCLANDGYKEIMPYDLYHPLPRWESSPWTACSTSCGGGGIQSRSVSCVEEDMQGTITPTEEWKCLYAPKTAILQPCNAFDCPTWLAQEWSPCTVTCGQGLRYRVVLCIDHRGLHAGGCNPTTKPHIKEECLVTVPCYKAIDTLPVEAKPLWHKQAIELEEEMVVTEEPNFIPAPWQPCSRTCGIGIRRRAVKCQVLLSFSQTVAELPDDECDGIKPPESQPCNRTPCHKPNGGDDVDEEDMEMEEMVQGEELYEWEYDGFTECSESCGGGVQEAVVICLNKQTREAALNQSLCVSARRPPPLLQDCKTQPCPPRWETGQWSSCSASCGVGLMSRTVACTHQPSRDSNRTEVLRDDKCHDPKPRPAQACNRFDCPPMWEAQNWGQCSGNCGDGLQRRLVLCKQRLADGSILELPDTFCPIKSPANQRACTEQPCPPQWVTSWSQCSVTCGNGIQRLEAVCRKQGEDGRHQTIDSNNCASEARPTRVRPCSLRLCKNFLKPGPAILAQRNVYIQWRKSKKVNLVVGSRAYLLPWTTVVLRCPTRHIRKGNIRWLKEGKPLLSLPHLSVTSVGLVKIQKVGVSDAGTYTCVAGQAQAHLVLQIIGNKQKGSIIEDINPYDRFVERLLQVKSASEDDLSIPNVLILNSQKLEDNLRGKQEEQLIAQLVSQLPHDKTNDSTLYHPESLLVPLLRKPHSTRFRIPVIIQKPRKVGSVSSSEVVVHVGSPVLLGKPVSTLEIKCETLGHPEPFLSWTKHGKQLHYNSRINLLPTGSLMIQSPNQEDEGLYTCTARNRLGSSSLSSWLQVTGSKGRNCVQGVCSDRSNESLCSGQDCSLRWRVDTWEPCSASCAGGSQTRRIRCVRGPEDGWKDVEGHHCLGVGRRPPDTRICNILPCADWATTAWGLCNSQCVGPGLATQHRHVFCQGTNGTKVANRLCSGLQRPSSTTNCSVEACLLQWRVGPWTQCTATCGRHGFQSRRVVCTHRATGRPTREHHCMWKPRPPSWQRCNLTSCGRAGECRDSTRYCEKVRQLELCTLPQFKSRCCHSCLNT